MPTDLDEFFLSQNVSFEAYILIKKNIIFFMFMIEISGNLFKNYVSYYPVQLLESFN